MKAEAPQNSCIACLQTIAPGARVCHHCGSSQHPDPLKKLSSGLKWIGGIVTVISLMIGMITLSGHYLDWREKQQTIAQIIGAAEWLTKTDNYEQAWQIYEQALKLEPASKNVFRGQLKLAQSWLRNFSIDKRKLDQTTRNISAVLYRGLTDADKDETATILAHIGRIQSIRLLNNMPVFLDIEQVFSEALAANPNNVYANAMYGFSLLQKRPLEVVHVETAQARFIQALKAGKQTEFVRMLQFFSLLYYGDRSSDEAEQAAYKALVQASFSSMQNDEKKPSEDNRWRILKWYGLMGHGRNVESAINFLPPEDQLSVYNWLLEGLDYKSKRMVAQTSYIRARLLEAAGQNKAALNQYNELLQSEHATEKLNHLIDLGIQRITGKLPARALAREYSNDAVDDQNPWKFHLDTLVHFDPLWLPANFDQAMQYFWRAWEQSDQRLPQLRATLADSIERVWNIVRDGDNRERANNYTSGYSVGAHNRARYNLVRLSVLYARVLSTDDAIDKALAVMLDMQKIAEKTSSSLGKTRVWVDFELARVYAIQSAASGLTADRKNALHHLKRCVQADGVDGNITTWDEIKGDSFKALRNETEYQKLILGR